MFTQTSGKLAESAIKKNSVCEVKSGSARHQQVVSVSSIIGYELRGNNPGAIINVALYKISRRALVNGGVPRRNKKRASVIKYQLCHFVPPRNRSFACLDNDSRNALAGLVDGPDRRPFLNFLHRNCALGSINQRIFGKTYGTRPNISLELAEIGRGRFARVSDGRTATLYAFKICRTAFIARSSALFPDRTGADIFIT